MMRPCDATLCVDSAGNPGHFDAIGQNATTYSASVGTCSEDRVTIWHGMDTPAISCGKHASCGIGGGPHLAVFRGHRARIADQVKDSSAQV